MFSQSKRDRQEMSSGGVGSHTTIISRGVRVEGEFTSQGDVHIDGDVDGHVTTTGMLTIGPEARLKADVSANAAVLAGTIEGTLSVKERLDLKSTARVFGDVTCATVAIEAGALLNGRVAVGGGQESVAEDRA